MMTARARRLAASALVAMALATATTLYAQQIIAGGNRFGYGRLPPKWAKESDFNGSFIYCRGFYNSRYGERGGQGWSTDYPAADNNFSVRLAELTTVPVKLDENYQPNYVVVALNDPLLFNCPMLFMEDVGTAEFSEQEVRNLREYFLKGGFLWVDDFWGSFAWENWVRQISMVLPPGEFPMFDIPPTHPIMRTLYDVKEIPQVCALNFWNPARPNDTSERGEDSAVVHFRGIQDSHGRLMVLMSHNTDISDTWEREGESREYFDLFSPRGYAIGVNTVLYALTH